MQATVLTECQNISYVTIRQGEVGSVEDKVNKAFRVLVDKCKSAGISTNVLIFF